MHFTDLNLTSSTAAYGYDQNGNMTVDAKKGLILAYNDLNRTERITITTATNRYIDYTYGASGYLIRKQSFDNSTLVKTTDYIGGFVYEDGTLAYFGMSEGRVRNASGTLTNEYMIKDQEGNVRVSFENNAGTALVRQENSYYPFGLTMPGSVTPTAANKNLYNGGSEWQDDFGNLPDLQQTFYRNYDAALGRFIGVDPVAEAADDMSTYQYAFCNPVMFNDPLGDQGGDYDQNPAERGASGINAVPFHGGYQRIGHASGNSWSNALDESRVGDGPFAALWGAVLGFIDEGGTGGLRMVRRSGEWGFWGQTTSKHYASENEEDLHTVELESKWYGGKRDSKKSIGKLNLDEANTHYLLGKGSPIYVDASSIDLRGISPDIFYGAKKGDKRVVQLLYKNFLTDGRVYGQLKLIYEGGKKVSIKPNDYNFDYGEENGHPWFKSVSGFLRNVFTFIGEKNADLFGMGQDYTINFIGTTNLNRIPQKPSANKSNYYPYY